jgi:hypothetical protein
LSWQENALTPEKVPIQFCKHDRAGSLERAGITHQLLKRVRAAGIHRDRHRIVDFKARAKFVASSPADAFSPARAFWPKQRAIDQEEPEYDR